MSSYRPFWSRDITTETDFSRRKEAIQNNLHGTFAFPFYEEDRLSGLIELFRRAPFEEDVDDPMLNLFTSIGIEFGLYLRRQQAEETVHQYTNVVEQSVNGIYSTDLNTIIKTWNSSAERIYGWKAEEMIGQSIKKIYHPTKLHEFDKIWQTLSSGKFIEHFESERIHKDGQLIWVDSSYGPITNSLGEITGFCVIVQDITSQKAMLQSLRSSEERFKIFIQITEEWIWEIDTKGNFTFSNEAVNKFIGYQIDEVIGRNITHFVSYEEKEELENEIAEHVSQKIGWVRRKLRIIHKNKSERWIESNISELIDGNDEIIAFRGASRYITESINIEKIKNEFISIINHELRTPLTSIYGALTLLKTKEFSVEEAQRLINVAQRNSERLSRLINEIMDVEKLQLGKFKLDLKEINLKDVIIESCDSAQLMAKKFEIKIDVKLPPLDIMIKADHARLVQVMMNLLSNAIKFSPDRGIIQVSMEAKSPFVKVSVKDQGSGVPKEFEDKIFQRFSQADSSSRRTFQGTGLGLSICKNIIELHDGLIQFTSKSGEGTTFYFELPLNNRG